ncbi:MAG: hypothetical protein AB9869_24780 [Verrucomicrobiia bacterium]
MAVPYASQTAEGPPTQAQVHTLNDGFVATVTLADELRAAVVEKKLGKGGTFYAASSDIRQAHWVTSRRKRLQPASR